MAMPTVTLKSLLVWMCCFFVHQSTLVDCENGWVSTFSDFLAIWSVVYGFLSLNLGKILTRWLSKGHKMQAVEVGVKIRKE